MAKEKEVRRVPNLRFKGFEGEWESNRLGDLVDFKVTNSFSRDNLNYEKGYAKNVHYGDIHTKFRTLFDITKEEVPYVNEDISLSRISEDFYCKEGDIIFADASEDLDDVGKSIEITNLNNEKLLSGLHTLLARPKENYFQKGFLGYLLKSDNVRLQIKKEAQGSKVLSINVGRISNVELLYPSEAEQKRVADFLSLIDNRINTQNKIIEELKSFKRLISKKIFSQNLKLISTNGLSNWTVKRLGEVCLIVGGGTPETNKIEYWNGDIQWFTPTEIKQNFVSKSDRTITKLGLKNSSAKILPKGAILLTTRATIGEVAIAENECTTNQGFQSLVVKEGFDSYFLFSWIKENKFELIKRANGSTFPEISKSEIEKIIIKIPDYSEQAKIGDFLFKIDKKIEVENHLLLKYENQKKYLLQNLFI